MTILIFITKPVGPMEPENEKVTNLDFLKNFTGNDSVRMHKYINMFLSAAPSDAENIRKGLAGENWEAVRASAHSLRPQMTYMGIKNGETLLKQIEEYAGERKNISQLPQLIVQFDQLFLTACSELQMKLSKTE
jgi:HPt (histidine-containing phosphotransfer) domain-containing protein